MAKFEAKDLIVAIKSYSRANALPLDSTEVYDTLAEATNYSTSPIAYLGQTIKAKLEDGKYHTYTVQPSESGYVLEEVGAIKFSDLKQYVIVGTRPEEGQEQGIIYIDNKIGYIWNGASWDKVFEDVSTDVTNLKERVSTIETELPNKAPLENPAFTGNITINGGDVALKSYVDGLISNIVNSAPGIVNSGNPLPVENYKAGQTFRVAETGNYAGQVCESGDLIIVVKDYNSTFNNDDFMVVQGNVDGAVTSTASTSTIGEIVVFDSVTGKVIGKSDVQIASLKDAISKSHEHRNKIQLDTFNKTQEELLASAKQEAQSLVTELNTTIEKSLENKADKGTKLADYGITDAYNQTQIDEKLKTITNNLNSKVDASVVDTKISEAKPGILQESAIAANEALKARVGLIPEETDIKTYIDNAVGSGGTASAEAIAKAKQEAINASKQYTDQALTIVEI